MKEVIADAYAWLQIHLNLDKNHKVQKDTAKNHTH